METIKTILVFIFVIFFMASLFSFVNNVKDGRDFAVKIVHFIGCSLGLAACVFLFLGEKVGFELSYHMFTYMCIYAISAIVCFVVASVCQEKILPRLIAEPLAQGFGLGFIIILAIYLADVGRDWFRIESFWQGAFLWFIATIIFGATWGFIGACFRSIVTPRTWHWPGNNILTLLYALTAFYCFVAFFSMCMEWCSTATFLALLGLISAGGGFSEGLDKDSTEGQQVMKTTRDGRQIQVIDEGHGLYRGNDNRRYIDAGGMLADWD